MAVSKQAQISRLMQEGKEGTKDLYLHIPFFMRTRLFGAIDGKQWDAVSERCEQGEALAIEMAKQMYERLLRDMEIYIDMNKQKTTDNAALMITDRNRVQNEFGSDAVRFVKAMAECLENEKQLIFMHSGANSQEAGEASEDSEDITDQPDEQDPLRSLEDWKQQAEQHLQQLNACCDQLNAVTEGQAKLAELLNPEQYSIEMADQEETMGALRWHTADIDSHEMEEVNLRDQQQNLEEFAMQSLRNIQTLCSAVVTDLEKRVRKWKVAEAKRSVRVGPEMDCVTLKTRFERTSRVLSAVCGWFEPHGLLKYLRERQNNANQGLMPVVSELSRLEGEFRTIEGQLFQINLIVTEQPKGVISIENKGSKQNPNYCTKKTQPFSTTLRVLGGEYFPSFQIVSANIELISEKELAQGKYVAVVGKDGKSCLKVESTPQNSPGRNNAVAEVKFQVEVQNFCRLEQNNVYKQFFRIHYKVQVSLNNTLYDLSTLSLPFTFNTGANQILEHMGARMWYCANCEDLYSGFQCPDPVSVSDVITMLDNRVTYLDKRKRRLTQQEKDFLAARLPNTKEGRVTMQGFLKDKMLKVRTPEEGTQLLPYSFYTWFYAVIHSIESLLLKAWLDGVIYGFCSEQTANDILMKTDIPEGAFILRPSISNIYNTSSADATAAIIMEVKMRQDDAIAHDSHDRAFHVVSVPLLYKTIQKNTLQGAVKGIEYNKRQVAQFLYGRDGVGRKLSALKGYVQKPNDMEFDGYRVLLQKLEIFSLRYRSSGDAAASDIKDEEDNSGNEPSRRKRRYDRSQSSASSQSTTASFQSGSSASTIVIDESSSGSGPLPAFNMLAASEVKQEAIQPENLPTSAADCQGQGHRSGTQDNHVPGTYDLTTSEFGSNTQGQWKSFGNLEIDTSMINVHSEVTVDNSGSPVGSSNALSPPEPTRTICAGSDALDINMCQPLVTPQFSPALMPGIKASLTQGYNGSVSSSNAGSPLAYDSISSHTSPAAPPGVGSPLMSGSSTASYPSGPESCTSPTDSCISMSPYQLQMQSPNNLPTVLSEADEPKRPSRRRENGNSSNNSTRSRQKKSPGSSNERLMWQTIPEAQPQQIQSTPQVFNLFNGQPSNGLIGQSNVSGSQKVVVQSIPGELGDPQQAEEVFSFLQENGLTLQQSPTDSGYHGEQTPSPEADRQFHPLNGINVQRVVKHAQDIWI